MRAKRVKVTKNQFNKIFEAYELQEDIPMSRKPSFKANKEWKKTEKTIHGFKAERVESPESTTVIQEDAMELVNNPEYMQHVLDLIKAAYSDKSQGGLDTVWKSLGVTRGEMYMFLSSLGILVASYGGYELVRKADPAKMVKLAGKLLLKKYGPPKEMASATDRLKKSLASKPDTRLPVSQNRQLQMAGKGEVEEDGGYPAGAENDTNAPYNDDRKFTEPTKVEQVYKVVHENGEIAILKDRNNRLLVYYIHGLEKDELADCAEREEIDQGYQDAGSQVVDYGDFDIDSSVIECYINNNYREIGLGDSVQDWEEGEKIVYISNDMKAMLLDHWKSDARLVAILNGVGETTTAGSSGAFVGSMNAPIKKTSNVVSQMGELIDEDQSGGERQAMDDFYRMILPANVKPKDLVDREEEIKKIVHILGIEADTKNESSIINDIVGLMQLATSVEEARKIKDFQEKGAFTEPFKKFQELKKDMEKRLGDILNGVEEVTSTVSAGSYQYDTPGFIDKDNFFGTKGRKKKRVAGDNVVENAQTDTQWPDGEFVEFDDCVRPGGQDAALNGGCSTGAVDNVVKTKKSAKSVISKKQS